MVQEVCVVQNKAIVSITFALLDKSGVNLIRNTGALGKTYEAVSGAVCVCIEIARRIQRPDILVERGAELMFVFENNPRLKSIERFVLLLLSQSVDRAQRIVVLIIVPVDRRRIEVCIFLAACEWNELFPLSTRFGVVAELRLHFTGASPISRDRAKEFVRQQRRGIR